jgi:type IV pilus assembly protein PilN
MRYDINLASRPYIDARRFYTNWLALLVPLALVAIVLLGYVANAVLGSRDAARKVRSDEARIAKLDQARARAEEVMNRPENKDVRDQSQFLNGVIQRKAFSWTQVMMELERLMPPHVHVLSIRPEVKDNQVQLEMAVAGDTRENVNAFVKALEDSETFRNPQLKSEDVKQASNGPSEIEFQLTTVYVPHTAAPAAPAASPTAQATPPKGVR